MTEQSNTYVATKIIQFPARTAPQYETVFRVYHEPINGRRHIVGEIQTLNGRGLWLRLQCTKQACKHHGDGCETVRLPVSVTQLRDWVNDPDLTISMITAA